MLNKKEIKDAYFDYIMSFDLEFDLTLELTETYVGKPLPIITKKLNHLLKRVNRQLYGRNFRKRGQFLKGIVVREGGIGFPHWHFLIERLPDHTIDLYAVFEEQCSLLRDKNGIRIFRPISDDYYEFYIGDQLIKSKISSPRGYKGYLRLIEQSKKGNIVNYVLKEI